VVNIVSQEEPALALPNSNSEEVALEDQDALEADAQDESQANDISEDHAPGEYASARSTEGPTDGPVMSERPESASERFADGTVESARLESASESKESKEEVDSEQDAG
jgi:hypothetical protein